MHTIKHCIREIFALSFLVGVIFGLHACTTTSATSTLVGKDIPSEYEGRSVYIKRMRSDQIDSIKVVGGTFSHTVPVDTTILYYVDIEGNSAGDVAFVPESGTLHFCPKEGADGFRIVGGRLNTELNTMISTASEMDKNQSKDVMKVLEDSTLTEREIQATHDALSQRFEEMKYNFFSDYLARHPQNAVGMAAFARLKYNSDEDFLAAYEAQSDVVKQGYTQHKRYEKILNSRKTQEGNPYTDFDIDTVEGDIVKFSDFMEEGKYLLVDFWASWCVPCRKVLPYVKEMVKRFPEDKLNVLSIGCFDKPEPYQKAAEEEDLPWKHILDVNSTGAYLYGVKSIPHFILIAPDGIIIKRATNVLQMETALEEVLLGK